MPESFVITPEMEKMMEKVMARYTPVPSAPAPVPSPAPKGRDDSLNPLVRECICCKIIKWAHTW